MENGKADNDIDLVQSYRSDGTLLVGVDVGGTKVAVLVVDPENRVLSHTTRSTILDSPQATLSGIEGAVRDGVAQAGGRMSDVGAVGIGVPGRVDPATGVVRRAVNLRWHEVQVGSALSDGLGVPCLLENDVRLAALGVQRLLGNASIRNLVYVSIGTGIAAGLILDGRVYRGAHGLAGEIGHMIVDPDGPPCLCGARGCLEALAAGPAIARLGEEGARSTPDTLLDDKSSLTAQAVYAAAEAGDRAALAVVKQASRYLAVALQQLLVTYDVECLVLGGGVARAGQTFLRPIVSELARLWQRSTLASETLQPGDIRLLPLDYDAGAWGAVALASASLRGGYPSLPDREKGGEEAQTTYIV